MSANKIVPLSSSGNFPTHQKVRFFKSLKQIKFSGQLVLTNSQGKEWSFYLYLGDITYATGINHPVRRWLRNLAAFCPQMLSYLPVRQSELSGKSAAGFITCWEYQLLCLWVAQQKITNAQAVKMIRSILLEVLLEIAQGMDVNYQINPQQSLSIPLILGDYEQALGEFQQLWQVWQTAQIANYSPTMAPRIKQPKQLAENTSDQVYQTLNNLLNGQHTLYDLAAQMKRDVVPVIRSILPFLQLGWVELIILPDIAIPVYRGVLDKPPNITASSGALIACVDDDLWVCKTMEKLLTAAGYQFVGVNDGLRAIATLLARKPDLIFLDLVMPHTNGYEICSKLRKLPFFSNTPIVILTGNDGVVDQVRAKLFGASDFLSKPIDAEIVLKVICKHLKAISH